MLQLIEFAGQRHEFPDDFTQAEIQKALSGLPRTPQLPGVAAADRRFPMLNDGSSVPAPQSPIPPLPPGYTLDAPTAMPPLPPGFKLDRRPTLVPVDHDPWAAFPDAPPLQQRTGMFDDLIPARPLEILPSNRQSADEIVHMAWFNPDVAAYLLSGQ